MDLKGKRALCFIALKHHGRFLFPVTRALQNQGMEILYPTAQAESPFELTMIEEGLPYRHAFSYLTPETGRIIQAGYQQVRAAWKERFLESSILQYFTLSLQDKALRMHVENFYLFRRMFEVEKPDLVLALHELGSWGKIFGHLSREFSVPFITFQEGLYWGPAEVNRYHTEYSTACLLWGNSTKEVLIRSGGCPDKMFVVGNTHLPSAIREAGQPDVLKRTRKELDLKTGNRLVTVIMGGLGYGGDFRVPEAFLNWARQTRNVDIVFKWHPLNNKSMIDRIQGQFQNIANVRSLQQYDTYRLLAASDVCVLFGNSTTGLEALAFGKPLVEVQIPGQTYSFSALGVAESAQGLGDVPQALTRLWEQGAAPDRERKVDEYLQHNLSSLDGKSVERTVDFIGKVLSVRDEQKQREKAGRGAPQAAGIPRNGATERKKDFLCSIVIPFTSADGVAETILSVAAHTAPDISYECILVNGGDAGEAEEVLTVVNGDIRLISSASRNLPAMCNLGMKEARGHYLCFLSPGLAPQPGWLEALLNGLETDQRVGVVGGKIVDANGRIVHAGVALDFNFTPSLLYRLLPADFAGADKLRKMRAVSGCLVVRRELFESLGGFDEKFGASLYDMDFCMQAGLDGWQTIYAPRSVLLSVRDEEEWGEADRLRFHAKWIGHLWPDQGSYWEEDGLDSRKLCELYEELIQEQPKVSPPLAD